MRPLSKKSEKFLESLHLYLISSGKKESETEGIVEELRDHLVEAEKQGKKVEDITGHSPQEYMKQVSNEMGFDARMLAKALAVILFGGLSYLLLGDIINGGAELTMVQLIGYPTLFILYVLSLSALLRYLAFAFHQFNKKKEYLVLGLFGFIKIALFITIITLDQAIDSPVIVFNMLGNWIAAFLIIGFFIGASIWAKTWIMIIVALILVLPEIFVQLLQLSEETSLITKSIIVFGGLLIYFWIINHREKSKQVYSS